MFNSNFVLPPEVKLLLEQCDSITVDCERKIYLDIFNIFNMCRNLSSHEHIGCQIINWVIRVGLKAVYNIGMYVVKFLINCISE